MRPIERVPFVRRPASHPLLSHLRHLSVYERPWFIYPLPHDPWYTMGSRPLSEAISEAPDPQAASKVAQLIMRYALRCPGINPMMLVTPRIAYSPFMGLHAIFLDELSDIMYIIAYTNWPELGEKCVAPPLMMTPHLLPRRHIPSVMEKMPDSCILL